MTAEPVGDAGQPQVVAPPPKHRRLSKPLLLLVILLVVLAASLGTVFTVGWYFPTEVAILHEGQFTMQVPIMTMYTPSNFTGMVSNAWAAYRFAATASSGSTSFQFSWSLANNASLPVEFSFQVPAWLASDFRSLGGGSFAYWPVGTCSNGCTTTATTFGTVGPGVSDGQAIVWRFNYTVRLMSRLAVFGSAQFLEVDLNPADPGGAVLASVDSLGLAPATGADLLSIGSVGLLGADIGFGFSTNDSSIHGRTFGYSPPAVSVYAGDRGPLSLRLTSTFRWSSVDWEAVTLRSGGNITVHEYVDLRFGSINLTVEPYTGP